MILVNTDYISGKELEMLGLIDALPGKQYALKTKGTKQNGRSDHR